jgi:phosphatidylglycerol---prolipoprotein diacylglyceryl transferase
MPNPLHVLGAQIPLTLSAVWYALGYGMGLLVFAWMARRRGFSPDDLLGILGSGLIGGLVGANLTHFLFTGTPGKTVLGGVAVGYLCVILYKRFSKIERPTGDLFAVSLMAGEAVGRWGCFFGGCCHGKPAELPWSVFQHDSLRHPTQVYLSLVSAVILALLLWREFRRPLPENGLFYLQGALYSVARFVIEFYRDGANLYAGLTPAQWACLVGVAFFGVRLLILLRQTANPILVNERPS